MTSLSTLVFPPQECDTGPEHRGEQQCQRHRKHPGPDFAEDLPHDPEQQHDDDDLGGHPGSTGEPVPHDPQAIARGHLGTRIGYGGPLRGEIRFR